MKINDKRILITGASGFIASHLTRRLVELGADVFITTKYKSVIDNIRLIDVWDNVTVIEADIRNSDSLKQISEIKPDVVYHFAAYNHVGDSFLHVSEAIDCNCKGTANVVESYDGYERFIYISSSEVYGYQEEVPFHEDLNPCPISPYSIGKYSGELYCRMKMTLQKYPIVILRPFNAFGSYQSPRAIIAEIILKCLNNEAVSSTPGIQTREFNYVENLIDGFLLACEKNEAVGEIINLGCGEEIPIKDLIMKIHKETGSDSELKIGDLEYRPTEIWRMFALNTKAREILGWKPKYDFEEGLKKTINWYRKFLEVYNNKATMLYQLSSMM